MSRPGLSDLPFRLRKIDRNGDPLCKLNTLVPWESFRGALETIHDKPRKSNAGRKPFDVILMFKMLVLQSLYNLSDEQTEQQVLDRLSFMRFLGIDLGDGVPIHHPPVTALGVLPSRALYSKRVNKVHRKIFERQTGHFICC